MHQLADNQIKSLFIVTSPQHKCLGEWNSYERAPDSAEKQQTIYIWTDSAKKTTNNLHMDRQCKKLHWSIYSAPDSAKKTTTAIYIWTDSAKKQQQQFTYGQTVQKKQQQFTYGQYRSRRYIMKVNSIHFGSWRLQSWGRPQEIANS